MKHDDKGVSCDKDIDYYAEWTDSMWVTSDPQLSLTIMSLGLSGETGEVMELLKKRLRDGRWDLDEFVSEMGDVIYYWAQLCRAFGIRPSTVLAANVTKLRNRQERKGLSFY